MKKYLLLFLMISAFGFAQELKPYLQAMQPSSVYVNWKTSSNEESIVEYGTSPQNLNITVNGTTNIFSDVGYIRNYYYHTVHLQNLTPNTKYYYKIKTGDLTSEIKSFKTLPQPGEAATEDGHIRFLIMGDNQLKKPRYDSLVSAAKRKIIQKYGGSPEDNIAMTFMVGDQVDIGTLDHYEHVHMKKNAPLSGNIAIQTTVGNHETYGTLGMQAYYDHFYIDQLSYQGISSNTENYYAYHAGNTLFISLSSEHTDDDQYNWLGLVMDAAANDDTVDWIISLSHRPYQAEQYIGDISEWVRNKAVPRMIKSPKYIMHIGAHHHLYHRGQLKNTPTYNIISGGTAWDQYWGMSSEEDYDDVQKTISNWIYQIIDIDVINGTMDVESYSIGSIYKWKDNELMDTFHRYKNKQAPHKPKILNDFADTPYELPLEIEGSEFVSDENEELNTTQFLISKSSSFDVIEKEVYRDFENLFGAYENRKDSTQDLNAGVDIKKFTIKENEISNGDYYVKARYRDKNLEWSPWSDVKTFSITGSTVSATELEMDTTQYNLNVPIHVRYESAPASKRTWIGLYDRSKEPGAFSPSISWSYTNGEPSGTMVFENGLSEKGLYYAAIFENGGYNEIANRVNFYAGPVPVLSTTAEQYSEGSSVSINFAEVPFFENDWIGVYKMGHKPEDVAATAWTYVTEGNGTFTIDDLEPGYYYAKYFLKDGYESIGNTVYFQVGTLISSLWINEEIYELGENITASWTDAPGIIKDWLGIYNQGDVPDNDPLISYTYFDGLTEGSIEIPDDAMPKNPGSYFIVMFTNDSYDEVSNRVNFEIIDSNLNVSETSANGGLRIYPNPVKTGDYTYLKCDYPIDKIELYNLEGKLLYMSKNINNQKYSFINQNIPTGEYIVRVYSNKVYSVKMLVK